MDAAECDKLCETGDQAACERLAALAPEALPKPLPQALAEPPQPKPDEAQAGGEAPEACAEPEACLQRAEALLAREGAHPARAAELLATLCEGEHMGRACFLLGKLAEEGRGVPESSARARMHFRTACEEGSADGCRRLAELHEQDGSPEALERAQRFWRELAKVLESQCEDENGFACGELASLHVAGKGVEADSSRAATLHEKACRLSKEACEHYPAPAAASEPAPAPAP